MLTIQQTTEECLKKWPDDVLRAARTRGDPEADRLAAGLLSPEAAKPKQFGASNFNVLMELMNKVIEAPELILVNDSALQKLLSTAPPEFVDYFDPLEAPAWVDEKKLTIASELWKANSLAMLATLMSASFPACYLMKSGISALYQSQKLLEHNYLFQRIYETGIMLDAVMDSAGLKIIRDIGTGGTPVRRFVWGKGYIMVKKVRFLHASMRFMLRYANPPTVSSRPRPSNPFAQAQPWDESLGAPVNQEDMVFTLFTFGLLLPRGLERTGRMVSRDQKEAFLHLWKLVGHLIGIEKDFLTDNLTEAEYLYNTIKEQQKGGSDAGVLLTSAVIQLVEDFLPHYFGINKHLVVLMMRDQLGKDDAELAIHGEKKLLAGSFKIDVERARAKAAAGEKLDKSEQVAIAKWRWLSANRNYPLRLLCFLSGLAIRAAYFVSDRVLRFIPLGGAFTQTLLHGTAEGFIASWRDAFSRCALDIPFNLTDWPEEQRATQAYRRALQSWRQKVFNVLIFAVGCLLLLDFGVAGYLLARFSYRGLPEQICFWGAVSSFVVMCVTLSWYLPRVLAARATIQEGSQ